jgi:hypothetical protein
MAALEHLGMHGRALSACHHCMHAPATQVMRRLYHGRNLTILTVV